MTDLTRHIDYLLLSHDCVIVPGLGAILAHTASACIAGEQSAMLPPKRTFTFNGSLSESDGLLTWSVSRTEGLSIADAKSAVESAVATMRRELSVGRTISLGKAGTLSMAADDSLTFSPAEAAAESLSPGNMWLPEIEVVPVKEAVLIASAAQHAEATAARRHAWQKIKVAAAVVALLAIGAILTIPVRMADNIQFASFIPSVFVEKPAPKPAAMELPGRVDAPVVLVLAKHADACEVVDSAEYYALRHGGQMPAQIPAEAEQTANPGRYCLVIASLGSTAEAETFVARHPDMKLGILHKDGRVRVYAASGESSADVLSKAKSLADRFPDAWVCRR